MVAQTGSGLAAGCKRSMVPYEGRPTTHDRQ